MDQPTAAIALSVRPLMTILRPGGCLYLSWPQERHRRRRRRGQSLTRRAEMPVFPGRIEIFHNMSYANRG